MNSVSRRLLGEAHNARRYLAISVVFGLAVTLLILAQAGLLAHALAAAAAGSGAAPLRSTLTGLLVVVVARAAAVHGGEVAALRGAAVVKSRLRSRLIRHALDLGPAWLGKEQAGELGTLATGGLDSLDPYFARYLPQLMLAVCVPAAVVVTVTSADWVSGVIIAATLPLIPLFAALVGRHVKTRTSQSYRLLARLSGHFLDVVQGLPTLKVLGQAKAQEQVIARVTGEYRASVMATLRLAFLSALVLELSAALATALVAVEVGLRLLYGHLGYQTALLVLLLTPEAYLPLRNASAGFHASADGMAAARRAIEVLDTAAPGGMVARGPHSVAVPDLRSHTITLEQITVVYPGRPAPAVDGLDLTIAPGERIMICGENGAGKSSVLSLLLRFTDPASGRIQAGGVDLADLPADQWRAQIGWLPQHPSLFPWTVGQNIALADPRASREEIERAAAVAGAAAFISRLPDGYDTVLDERALRLSAGERQKIALARLILRPAALILLDEPTAHLDPASSTEIAAVIGDLAVGRTVVVVTHRDLGLAGFGRLLVASGGTFTEAPGRDLPESVYSIGTEPATAGQAVL